MNIFDAQLLHKAFNMSPSWDVRVKLLYLSFLHGEWDGSLINNTASETIEEAREKLVKGLRKHEGDAR
jgi:hypothetical protein